MEDLSTGDISDESFLKGSTDSTRRDWDTDLTSTSRIYRTEENSKNVLSRQHADNGADASTTSSNRSSVKSIADRDGNRRNVHLVQRSAKDENNADPSALGGPISRSYGEQDKTYMTNIAHEKCDVYDTPLLNSHDTMDFGNSSNPRKTSSKRSLAKSDSLPYHRSRLGQKCTPVISQEEIGIMTGENEQDPLLIHRRNSSSDTSLCKRGYAPRRKVSPKRFVCACPYANSLPRVPRGRRSASSSRQVDSWFGDQNFDYIDACYAEQARQSQSSQNLLRSGLKPYVRRDEIAFGAPTPRDITFNVSGQYYRVDPDLLAKYPDTLLGNREKRAKFWDESRNEYFLDKHKATFEVIIDYYIHNGALNRPDDIPIDIFINEIKFYCLDRENLEKFLSAEGILLVEKEKEMPDTEIKKYIWNLFEDPESCKVARVVTTMSALVIAISVVVFCMETVPRYESLGNESLKYIEPALLTCQSRLCNDKQYYEANRSLFSADTDMNNDTLRCDLGNTEVDQSLTPTAVSKKGRHVRSADPTATAYQTTVSIGAGTQYDDFDGSVLLSTMTETLKICSQITDFSILSRYTYLRCKSELGDYVDNPQSLLATLGEIEFHENHEEENPIPPQTTALGKITATSSHKFLSDSNLSHAQPTSGKSGRLDDSSEEGGGAAKHIRHSQVKPSGNNHTKIQSEVTTIFKQYSMKHHQTPTRQTNSTNKRHRSRKSHRKGHKRSTRPISSTNTSPSEKKKKLMTLKQTFRGLIQLCHKLDNKSIRSSYHWLVLEATLGGAAGLLFLIESGCIVWFVIEICLRFYSCPNKKKFCTDFLNVIDAIAIMPYFITLIVTSLHTDSNLRPQTATILRKSHPSSHDDSNFWLWTIRLVRMLRILKLSRHSRGLRILGLTLVRSTRVLVLLVCFQMVLAVTFSSIVYYVEYDAPDTKFKSIPSSFWWAIITMTTVGYGDVVPVTTLGKITGAFCAIMGILGIAFPVPVIVSNFNYLYNLDSDACKLTPEELMEDEEENDNDRNNNVEKFQENLFDAVRKNVGSMTSAPQEGQPTGQNPAELWNYTRRQYFSSEKKSSTKSSDPASKQKY